MPCFWALLPREMRAVYRPHASREAATLHARKNSLEARSCRAAKMLASKFCNHELHESVKRFYNGAFEQPRVFIQRIGSDSMRQNPKHCSHFLNRMTLKHPSSIPFLSEILAIFYCVAYSIENGPWGSKSTPEVNFRIHRSPPPLPKAAPEHSKSPLRESPVFASRLSRS